MIEALAITANPVTKWEQYAGTFLWGSEGESLSSVEVTSRARYKFHKARATIHANPSDLFTFFQDGLGRQVQFFSTNGQIVWEGYIDFMRLVGVSSFPMRKSLGSLYTRAWVRFQDTGGTLQKSVSAEDAYALSRYGIKEYVGSGGQLQSTTLADSLARQVIRKRKRPKAVPENLRYGGQSGATPKPAIELAMNGWIHTLDWRRYNQTVSAGTQSADLQIATILTAVGQFIAGYTLEPNSVSVTKKHEADRTALDICGSIADMGDPYDQPWTLFCDVGRWMYYQPRSTAINMEG